MLTISLPVYNSHDLLLDQLDRINSQLQNGVTVNVYDNCSKPSISDVIKKKFPNYVDWINIETNEINIGADGNILKCFSKSKTDWLWVLSVNDLIHENAIDNILSQIRRNKDSVFINFVENNIVGKTEGFKDFCTNVPSYSRAFFISVCIYNTSLLKKQLFYYNEYLSSNNGQLLLVLKELEENGGSCIFPSEKILDYETPASWSKSSFLKRSLLLFDAFEGDSKKIFKNTLGLKMQHLLLYYNGLIRINNEIKFFQQFKNLIMLMFAGNTRFLLKKESYKLLIINCIIFLFPRFYSKYFLKR